MSVRLHLLYIFFGRTFKYKKNCYTLLKIHEIGFPLQFIDFSLTFICRKICSYLNRTIIFFGYTRYDVCHYNAIDMRTITWHFILDDTMQSWIKFSCSSKKFFENVYGSHLFIKISKDKNVPFCDSYDVMVVQLTPVL